MSKNNNNNQDPRASILRFLLLIIGILIVSIVTFDSRLQAKNQELTACTRQLQAEKEELMARNHQLQAEKEELMARNQAKNKELTACTHQLQAEEKEELMARNHLTARTHQLQAVQAELRAFRDFVVEQSKILSNQSALLMEEDMLIGMMEELQKAGIANNQSGILSNQSMHLLEEHVLVGKIQQIWKARIDNKKKQKDNQRKLFKFEECTTELGRQIQALLNDKPTTMTTSAPFPQAENQAFRGFVEQSKILSSQTMLLMEEDMLVRMMEQFQKARIDNKQGEILSNQSTHLVEEHVLFGKMEQVRKARIENKEKQIYNQYKLFKREECTAELGRQIQALLNDKPTTTSARLGDGACDDNAGGDMGSGNHQP